MEKAVSPVNLHGASGRVDDTHIVDRKASSPLRRLERCKREGEKKIHSIGLFQLARIYSLIEHHE